MNHRKEEKKGSDFRLLGLALLFILFIIGQVFGQPFDPTAWNPDDGWDQKPEIQEPTNFVQELETTNFVQEDNQIRYPETPSQPQNKDANTYDVNLDGTTISHETIPGSDKWGVQIEKDYGSTQLSGTIWVIVGGGLSPSIPLGWVGQNIAIGDRVNIGGRYDPEMHSVTLYGNAGYYMRLLSKQPTPNPEPNPEPYPEPTPKPYPTPNPEPVPVNLPPSVLELIPNKPSPQSPGSAVDWTATASDPDSGDIINYKFMINNATTNSQWQDMTGWSTSNKWTWSPTESDLGENYISVAVRDGNHAAADDYDNFKQMAYTISQENQPPKVTNIYTDLVSPQKVGSPIIWTASATDPDSSDTIYYKFMIKNNASNDQWQETRGWSNSSSWTWTPTSSDIGKSSIGVFARDGMHATEDDYDSYMGDYFDIIEDNQPPKLNGVKADPSSPEQAGTPVTWTADALDPDSGDTIYYKFMLSGPGTNNQYQDKTGWITTSTWTWNPSSADAGRNSIDVLIRDGKHAPESDHDAHLEAYFEITKENLPPTVTSLTPDQASPQKAGSTIIWTAKASDPENDTIEYQFTLEGKVAADWSNSNTWLWSPGQSDIGDHSIGVCIRDGHHAGSDGCDDKNSVAFEIKKDLSGDTALLTVQGEILTRVSGSPGTEGMLNMRVSKIISNTQNVVLSVGSIITVHSDRYSTLSDCVKGRCQEFRGDWTAGALWIIEAKEISREHYVGYNCSSENQSCTPGSTGAIQCKDNKVLEEFLKDDCTKEWRIKDDCNSYSPTRRCEDGKCVEDKSPESSCDELVCKNQSHPNGEPYLKNGRKYQNYRECKCEGGSACNCRDVDYEEIEFIGNVTKRSREATGTAYYKISLDQLIIGPSWEGPLTVYAISIFGDYHNWGTYDHDIIEGDQVQVYGRCLRDKSITLNGKKNYYIKKLSNGSKCRGIISGHVYDSVTKKPISGAILSDKEQICGEKSTTYVDGFYEFSIDKSRCNRLFCPFTEYRVTCKERSYLMATQNITTDPNGNAKLDFYLHPIDKNWPIIIDAEVRPTCGKENSQLFEFTAKYKDEDGDEPIDAYIRIYSFNGSKKIYDTDRDDPSGGKMKPSGGNARDGITYQYYVKLPKGEYKYYVYFGNVKGSSVYLPPNGFTDGGLKGPIVGVDCCRDVKLRGKVVEYDSTQPYWSVSIFKIIEGSKPESNTINVLVKNEQKGKYETTIRRGDSVEVYGCYPYDSPYDSWNSRSIFLNEKDCYYIKKIEPLDGDPLENPNVKLVQTPMDSRPKLPVIGINNPAIDVKTTPLEGKTPLEVDVQIKNNKATYYEIWIENPDGSRTGCFSCPESRSIVDQLNDLSSCPGCRFLPPNTWGINNAVFPTQKVIFNNNNNQMWIHVSRDTWMARWANILDMIFYAAFQQRVELNEGILVDILSAAKGNAGTDIVDALVSGDLYSIATAIGEFLKDMDNCEYVVEYLGENGLIDMDKGVALDKLSQFGNVVKIFELLPTLFDTYAGAPMEDTVLIWTEPVGDNKLKIQSSAVYSNDNTSFSENLFLAANQSQIREP